MIPMVSYAKQSSNIRRLAFPATIILVVGTGGCLADEYTPGTGGDLTRERLRILDAKLVLKDDNNQVITCAPSGHSVDIKSAAYDLRYIKSVLKISTSDSARVLGVSRQAIYNWKAGSHIKPDNLSKLTNLKSAADVFVQARLTVSPQMLERRLSDGGTILDRIAAGRSGSEAAAELLNLLSDDADQRRELDAILAGNTSRKPDAFDYGVPAVSEG